MALAWPGREPRARIDWAAEDGECSYRRGAGCGGGKDVFCEADGGGGGVHGQGLEMGRRIFDEFSSHQFVNVHHLRDEDDEDNEWRHG